MALELRQKAYHVSEYASSHIAIVKYDIAYFGVVRS